MRKLNADHLRTVLIFEESFDFLNIGSGKTYVMGQWPWGTDKHYLHILQCHSHTPPPPPAPNYKSVLGLTSTGVVSGTSLRMMMQRLWFGRTFSPFSSTWTIGEAGSQAVRRQHLQVMDRPDGIHFRQPPSQNRVISLLVSHLKTSRIRSMSVVSALMPSMLAMVQMGTNWSLSIWDIRYKSFERFSLKDKGARKSL